MTKSVSMTWPLGTVPVSLVSGMISILGAAAAFAALGGCAAWPAPWRRRLLRLEASATPAANTADSARQANFRI